MAELTKPKSVEFTEQEIEALAAEAGVELDAAVLSLTDNEDGTHTYHVSAS